MKSSVVSVTAKACLFVLSTLVGMVSYVVVKGSAAGDTGSASSASLPVTSIPHQTIDFNAEPVLLGRTENPVDLSADALGIFYVLEKDGDIVRISPDADELTGKSNEYASLSRAETAPGIGFVAMALHPEFLVKDRPGYGKFYVVAAEAPGTGTPDFNPEFGGGTEHHQDVLYEYTSTSPLSSRFEGQRREVLRLSQPGSDHNLSSLAFDPHGHLFLGVGDGANDQVNRLSASKNASSLLNVYGKVLRIDPLGKDSRNGRYGIPESNPFRMVSDCLPEIWAFGLRAPHSLSYDPYQRRLCIGEIGLDRNEKIHVSQYGGEHFGWDLDSGNLLVNFALRSQLAEMVTPPVVTLDRRSGLMGRATGNLVYRGESFPSLTGRVIVASHDGQLMAAATDEYTYPEIARLKGGGLSSQRFSAVRTSARGELVVLCEDGRIYELRKGASLGEGKSKHRKLYCGLPSRAGDRG